VWAVLRVLCPGITDVKECIDPQLFFPKLHWELMRMIKKQNPE
jgi:hypothetical protein